MSDKGQLTLHNIQGKKNHTILKHKKTDKFCCFDVKLDRIVAGTDDGKLFTQCLSNDNDTGRVNDFDETDPITAISFHFSSYDYYCVISGEYFRMFDWNTGSLIKKYQHTSALVCMSFVNDEIVCLGTQAAEIVVLHVPSCNEEYSPVICCQKTKSLPIEMMCTSTAKDNVAAESNDKYDPSIASIMKGPFVEFDDDDDGDNNSKEQEEEEVKIENKSTLAETNEVKQENGVLKEENQENMNVDEKITTIETVSKIIVKKTINNETTIIEPSTIAAPSIMKTQITPENVDIPSESMQSTATVSTAINNVVPVGSMTFPSFEKPIQLVRAQSPKEQESQVDSQVETVQQQQQQQATVQPIKEQITSQQEEIAQEKQQSKSSPAPTSTSIAPRTLESISTSTNSDKMTLSIKPVIMNEENHKYQGSPIPEHMKSSSKEPSSSSLLYPSPKHSTQLKNDINDDDAAPPRKRRRIVDLNPTNTNSVSQEITKKTIPPSLPLRKVGSSLGGASTLDIINRSIKKKLLPQKSSILEAVKAPSVMNKVTTVIPSFEERQQQQSQQQSQPNPPIATDNDNDNVNMDVDMKIDEEVDNDVDMDMDMDIDMDIDDDNNNNNNNNNNNHSSQVPLTAAPTGPPAMMTFSTLPSQPITPAPPLTPIIDPRTPASIVPSLLKSHSKRLSFDPRRRTELVDDSTPKIRIFPEKPLDEYETFGSGDNCIDKRPIIPEDEKIHYKPFHNDGPARAYLRNVLNELGPWFNVNHRESTLRSFTAIRKGLHNGNPHRLYDSEPKRPILPEDFSIKNKPEPEFYGVRSDDIPPLVIQKEMEEKGIRPSRFSSDSDYIGTPNYREKERRSRNEDERHDHHHHHHDQHHQKQQSHHSRQSPLPHPPHSPRVDGDRYHTNGRRSGWHDDSDNKDSRHRSRENDRERYNNRNRDGSRDREHSNDDYNHHHHQNNKESRFDDNQHPSFQRQQSSTSSVATIDTTGSSQAHRHHHHQQQHQQQSFHRQRSSSSSSSIENENMNERRHEDRHNRGDDHRGDIHHQRYREREAQGCFICGGNCYRRCEFAHLQVTFGMWNGEGKNVQELYDYFGEYAANGRIISAKFDPKFNGGFLVFSNEEDALDLVKRQSVPDPFSAKKIHVKFSAMALKEQEYMKAHGRF
eukprot:TRINITY_DN33133_c0_g1_i1.p1 TRINITY_DN33133_c0_g1~~TRINITY_DN33133_c0_g1_i1.p1  ORF type:complete len:1178 (-),score=406.65 TRINITY_DN33133_c0_g1_i1:150-3614(-)